MANVFLHKSGKQIIPRPASAARWMRRHPDKVYSGKFKYLSNGTNAMQYLLAKAIKERYA